MLVLKREDIITVLEALNLQYELYKDDKSQHEFKKGYNLYKKLTGVIRID